VKVGNFLRLLLPDAFGLSLLGAVAVATLFPLRGEAAVWGGRITVAAIMLLFFLHGAKLSREAVVRGLSNWRLHAAVLGATFVMFPLLGLLGRYSLPGVIGPELAAGMLFLCLLPSTVQSSIAFTSLAGGDVPAAVASASASNLLGVFITPALVAILMPEATGSSGVSLQAVGAIFGELLLPFAAGHFARPWIAAWVHRRKSMLTRVDQGSILLVVFTAFSAAVVQGLWTRLSVQQLLLLLGVCLLLLVIALTLTLVAGRAFGFSRQERITLLFCGSKKSLATGAPMAGLLFPAASAGLILTPLILFHQVQLMACAVIARRYAESGAAAKEAERVAETRTA
jgi:sodium/bile acid cotransporter 7